MVTKASLFRCDLSPPHCLLLSMCPLTVVTSAQILLSYCLLTLSKKNLSSSRHALYSSGKSVSTLGPTAGHWSYHLYRTLNLHKGRSCCSAALLNQPLQRLHALILHWGLLSLSYMQVFKDKHYICHFQQWLAWYLTDDRCSVTPFLARKEKSQSYSVV